MVKSFYSVLVAALAALLLTYCLKPTDPSITHSPAVYIITYDGNGATFGTVPIDSTEYREGDILTVKGNTGNLAQGSKDFVGWVAEQGAAEPLFNEGDTFEVTRSLTLYAVWEDNFYTINFDKNHPGAGGAQVSLIGQIWGAPITLPAASTLTFTPPADMRFAGWAETSDGAVIQGAYTGPANYSPTVTLYAVWGNPYTINFDKNHAGAVGPRSSLTGQIWKAPITLPAVDFTPPTNMRFAGWAETSGGAVIQGAYTGPASYSPTVTLYAIWEDNSYTIDFGKNHPGAGGAQASLTGQIWGAPITLPAPTFTPPPGMGFAGWAKTSDGPVIQGAYTGSASYSPIVTLYAVWGNPYTINFDKVHQDAGGTQESQTDQIWGDPITLPAAAFTPPPGMNFAGWAKTSDGPVIQGAYTGPASYSPTVTLYAVWGEPYTIDFDKNHPRAGGAQASQTGQIWRAPITLPAVDFTPPAGMSFAGWAETSGGPVIQGDYTGPASYSPTVTLYAVWRGNHYTINFENHAGAGGTQSSLTGQIWGAPITLPAVSTFTPPTGMRFAGWAETSNGAVIQGAYTGPASHSPTVTLYAVWRGNHYTINFDKNHQDAGGTQSSLTGQIWRDPVTLPAASTSTLTFTPPADMSFAGWAETSDGAVIQGDYTGPASYRPTVTLYAVWRGNSYTINFDKVHQDAGGTQESLTGQIWGDPVTFPPVAFIPPTDMSFAGWAKTSDGPVIQGDYTGPATYRSTVTLYAVWGNSYTINFDKVHQDAGGTQESLTGQIWKAPITLPAASFTPPADMRFAGWAETSDGPVIQGAFTGPASYSPTVTLYAVWRGNSYTINFDDNHAGAGGTQESLTGQIWKAPITLPAASFTPPADMRFAGWAKTSDGAVIQGDYTGPATYSSTVTLYAVWKGFIFGRREWQTIAMSSNGTKLAAAEYRGHLYTSADSGATWTDRSGAGSAIAGNRRWQAIAMSSNGTELAAVVDGGHLYTSADSGATWTDRSGASSTIAGNREWRDIAMSSDGTKLAAVVDGGHLYTSADSGANWTDRSGAILTIAGNRKWQAIAMSSNGTELAAVEHRGHLYTSADSGATWTDRSGAGSTIAGDKKWRDIAMSSDGSELAAVVYGGYLYTSTDSGANWTDRSGASSTIAGKRKWQAIAMSDDGTKLAAAVGHELPLAGGHLYTSADSGATWTDRSGAGSTIEGDKRWQAIAMSSDGTKLAAVVDGGHLYTSANSGANWTDRSGASSTIAGNRKWQAIAMSSDGSELAAAEHRGHLYTSANSGANWEPAG